MCIWAIRVFSIFTVLLYQDMYIMHNIINHLYYIYCILQLNRLCRPGSIVGPQQQYLESIEERMLREGAEYRLKHRLPHPSSTAMPHDEVGVVVVVVVVL